MSLPLLLLLYGMPIQERWEVPGAEYVQADEGKASTGNISRVHVTAHSGTAAAGPETESNDEAAEQEHRHVSGIHIQHIKLMPAVGL